MADAAAFWDRIADWYAKKPVKDTESYEKTLECVRKHLSASDDVLEVGCGTGSTALWLAPHAEQILATDFSSRMIGIAQRKAAAQQVENVRFEQATLFDDSLAPGRFDVVMAFNLLHLLDDLPGALRWIGELLKPGGMFISKTVCLGEQASMLRFVLPIMKALGLGPLVRVLTIAELETALTDAGFELVETGLHPPSPPSRFIVARKV